MDFSTADNILKGFNIPVQPLVVSNILRLLPDLGKISEMIQQDPCLTASCLKLANHDILRQKIKITLVDDAVQLLGVSGITAMLNVQLLRKASIEGMQESALANFWKINNDVAFACGLLARQLNIAAVDDAYYLGLFHNIGMPIIWQKHAEYFALISHDVSVISPVPSILDIENEAFNCSHTSVGYYVTRGMSLDLNICEAVRLHHDVVRVFESGQIDDEVITNISLLKAAEFILSEISSLHGRASDLEWQFIKSAVLDQLGLSEMDFQDLDDIIREETMMRVGF